MYLLVIILGMCLVSFVLFFLFPLFFKQTLPPLKYLSVRSLGLILLLSLIIMTLSVNIADRELNNRIIHTFGGGFLTFFICFLAVKDTRISITKFQFFVLSFLIVTALGVMNEIAEFVLQNYAQFAFARNVNDTWFDLTSNAAGALIASVCFVPFVRTIKKSS